MSESFYAIIFEDKDHAIEIFNDEQSARNRYAQALERWNCKLMVEAPQQPPAPRETCRWGHISQSCLTTSCKIFVDIAWSGFKFCPNCGKPIEVGSQAQEVNG